MTATPKEIAEWHRQKAKELEAIAKKHREMADFIKAEAPPAPETRSVATGPTLTLRELESALAQKGGRVAHVAARLQVTPEAIETLLKFPDCKYEIGERGFIYLKSGQN